jgi:hypothetical protein
MDVGAILKGLVRGVEEFKSLAVGKQGDLKVSKLMPDYAQLVAEGRVWRAQEPTATASVTALPTTAGLYTLANNEPDDGLWYVVLAVTAFNSANAAVLDSFGLAGVISQLPAATGGLNATVVQDIAKTNIKSMCGVRGGGYNGRAMLDAGLTVTDDDWFPIADGSGSTAIASATGMTLFKWIHGLIILSPKTLFSMVSTATSTSNTTRKGLIWAEVPKSYLLAA